VSVARHHDTIGQSISRRRRTKRNQLSTKSFHIVLRQTEFHASVPAQA
jgi:hypothetical protein